MKRPYLYALLITMYAFIMGFSLDNALVPRDEILSGGPPKDGIPALLEPKFVSAAEAHYMNADDPVLGVVISGEPKAYPIKILNWHEVVNDVIADTPVAVTF